MHRVARWIRRTGVACSVVVVGCSRGGSNARGEHVTPSASSAPSVPSAPSVTPDGPRDAGSVDGSVGDAAELDADVRPLPSPAKLTAPLHGVRGSGFVAMTGGSERVRAFATYGSREIAPDKPVLVASFTKLWTAVATLRMVERGELSLDATIADALPELASRPWSDSTIRELLGHVSRVPELDDKGGFYRKPGVDFGADPGAVLASAIPRDWSEKRGVYKYRNAELAVVGAILAARAHTPAARVLAREVFEPAHMTRAGLLVGRVPEGVDLDLTPMGPIRPQNFFTAGAGYASANDLLAFFEALGGDTLLNAASKEALFGGIEARGYAALGCWAYPFAVAGHKTERLVERPGSFGNVRLFTAFFPDERRAIVAFNADGVDIARPRANPRGLGARLAEVAIE